MMRASPLRYLWLLIIVLVMPTSAGARTVTDRIREDLASGKDVVVVSYVALWNPRKGQVSKKPTDLYWDALYGHDTFFDRPASLASHLPFLELRRWTTIRKFSSTCGPVATKVMAATVPGTSGARMVVVYLAYKDRERAMREMVAHLKAGTPPYVPGLGTPLTVAVRSSYVVGYWGHNGYNADHNPDLLELMPVTARDLPRGVFVVGCQTAKWYPQKVMGPGIEPILFTSNRMPPEGYVAAALYDGLARGMGDRRMRLHLARAMRAYHPMSHLPVALFVNTPARIAELQAPLPPRTP